MKRMELCAMTTMAGTVILAGCATPVTHIPTPSAQSMSQMRTAFQTFDASRKERQVSYGEQPALEAVERVRRRVMPAAMRVCQRMFSGGCAESFASMKVMVYPHNETVNAFAAEDGRLGFYGGFIRLTGNARP